MLYPARADRTRGVVVIAWGLALGLANLVFLYAVARITVPPHPIEAEEYFLTSGLMDGWGKNWMWVVPGQVVVGVLGGRLGAARWRSTWLSCVGWYLLLVAIEGFREPTSHNLLPLEVGFWAGVCLPVVAGVVLGRLGAIRSLRRANGEPRAEAHTGARSPDPDGS